MMKKGGSTSGVRKLLKKIKKKQVPDKRRPENLPGFGKPRSPKKPGPGGTRPKPDPRRVTPLQPVSKKLKDLLEDLKKAKPMKDGGVMDLARKIKSSGRLNTDDIKRARAMLRKGQKPVLDSKGKPVKNLTQKAGPGKPMTPEQKKQIEKFKNVLKKLGNPPRRKKAPKEMIPLIGKAAKGMQKGLGGRSMKAAAKKLKRIM
jgi:hypothetical protein